MKTACSLLIICLMAGCHYDNAARKPAQGKDVVTSPVESAETPETTVSEASATGVAVRALSSDELANLDGSFSSDGSTFAGHVYNGNAEVSVKELVFIVRHKKRFVAGVFEDKRYRFAVEVAPQSIAFVSVPITSRADGYEFDGWGLESGLGRAAERDQRYRPLTQDEIGKIDGVFSLADGTFSGRLHNGNAKVVVAEVVYGMKHSRRRGSGRPVYRTYRSGVSADPLSTTPDAVRVVGVGDDYKFDGWWVQEARGYTSK